VSRARTIRIALALGATWALGGAASAAASCPGADSQVQALNTAQLESSVVCLINEERTSRGIRPVQSDASLRAAAQSHSSEMVSESYFAHTSPKGLTFSDRITQAGYTRGARFWLIGENLVWGSGSLSSPNSLVTSWMNSPPHRENLLRGRYRQVGVAAVLGTPENASDPTGVTVSSEYGYKVRVKIKRRSSRGK
jgi:uncharacterized protein YkwD